jgi:cell division GTPase FtsZ
MMERNLNGVSFLSANTDAQSLARSKAPVRIQLGEIEMAGKILKISRKRSDGRFRCGF